MSYPGTLASAAGGFSFPHTIRAATAGGNSTTGAAATTTEATAAPAKFDEEAFVFQVDVFLFCLFGLYVLATLPRAIARYSYGHGFFQGLFLRSGTPKSNNNAGLYRSDTGLSTSSRAHLTASMFVDSYSSDSHSSYLDVKGVDPNAANNRPPTRIARLATIIHPLVSYTLNYRIAPGFSVGKLIVCGAYSAMVLFAAFHMGSNPFTDPKRAGYVGASQLPIVIGFAMKNNILSWVSGMGYERLNYLHRLAGRLAILAINVHTVGYLYKWNAEGKVASEFAEPKYQAGLIGVIGADILYAFSLPVIRERCYHLFFYSHILGFFAFMFGGMYHFKPVVPYAVAGLLLHREKRQKLIRPYNTAKNTYTNIKAYRSGRTAPRSCTDRPIPNGLCVSRDVYAFDHLLRTLKTRTTTALLTPLPALGATHISLPDLTTGWRAGQHIRLRVPVASGHFFLGVLWNWTFGRARPFSIATAPGGNGLELVVKSRRGKWTGALYDAAGGSQVSRKVDPFADPEKNQDVEFGYQPCRRVRVIVEGPYSGPGYTMFTAYSGALLVAGGSGITFVLSILDDILRKHSEGRSRLRVVEVVWSVSDPAVMHDLLPSLAALLRPRPSPHAALTLRISVHYTRASKSPSPSTPLPAEIRLRPARPNIGNALVETVESVCSSYMVAGGKGQVAGEEYPSGVIVGCCGPVQLGDQANEAVGGMDWKRWREVGGVELYEEVFGW